MVALRVMVILMMMLMVAVLVGDLLMDTDGDAADDDARSCW